MMGSSYKDLFKLYDLIHSGDCSSVERFLRNNKIDINVILPCKGIGILHLSVGIEPEEKSKICTEIILKHGGDPNLSNGDGITPVHIAAIWGRLDNLKLLIGCGGDPSWRDFDGLSAFDYAAREQQWQVFDYLQNVIDQMDTLYSSPCAYTLDLDKVLVTTDQMVAEYEPVPESQTDKSCRKSEMVRNWCDKTVLVMNKLYPTILSETYILDQPLNVTNNMTLDLTQVDVNGVNDSKSSFKTCTSKRDIISGIERLDITRDKSNNLSQNTDCKCSTLDTKQRFSLYENFSLPGSPNSITHKNYNNKSSLKCRNCELTKSIVTEDRSVDLDKAIAVVQNKTNEWLSSSSMDSDGVVTNILANTRRSSTSSGVSSFSGGNIAIANVMEEYRYTDEEENVVLIEKRLLTSTVVLPLEEAIDSCPNQTAISVASSLPASVSIDNNTLRNELIKLGFKPGPIVDSTRTLYLKKLKTLTRNPIVTQKQGKTYSIELEKSLRSEDWMKDLSTHMELEAKVRLDFSNANKKWREGTAKTSFTYLLLDPRMTNNLPVKAGQQNQHLNWVTFVNSIFYVGKGKRSRPYSHLYQALTLWKRNFTSSNDKKVQHILNIWSDKVGVICLHIFQNVIPAEAYTYEAAMIDVLGLPNLKNLKTGNYYGVAASWPLKERRMLGLYLLYKAMLIFLSEGERQLRPDDID